MFSAWDASCIGKVLLEVIDVLLRFFEVKTILSLEENRKRKHTFLSLNSLNRQN